MADDYKRKLSDFLGDKIPWKPKNIISGEAKPPPYDEAFKKQLKDPKFQLPTDPLFLKYTGMTHLRMIRDWNNKVWTTACNDLAGTCGTIMGAKHFLGQFELEALLRGIGKEHAWVPALSGERPDYGDIFRSQAQHMGVCLGFEGDDWLFVEAGQGGPKVGYDALWRNRQPFDPSTLRGWCDMRLYLDRRGPLPDWLIGNWLIYCGKEIYHYKFNKYYEAFQYPWKPIGGLQFADPIDTGTVSYQGFDCFTVTWKREGWIEKLKYNRFESFPGLNERMTGSTYRDELFEGVRL